VGSPPGNDALLTVGGTFNSFKSNYGSVGTNRSDSLFDVYGSFGVNSRLVSIHGSAPNQSLFEAYSHNGSNYLSAFKIRSVSAGLPEVIIGYDPGGSGMLRVGGGADIKGTVRSREVVVTLAGWADQVFAPDYKLASLSEVAEHIQSKRHLPGIPSESDIVKNGLSIGEMQRLQMAKIEELTLYAIEADRRQSEAKSQAILVEKNLRMMTEELNRSRADNQALWDQNTRLEARLQAIERALSVSHQFVP
jgi:hypothetical protein